MKVCIDVLHTNALEDTANKTKTHAIKTLQKQDAYCKHIYNTLHVPSGSLKFITKDDN